MSAGNPRQTVSRRGRPAKAPLSRDLIVTTALAILDQDGLHGLSLRRVAAALDTGAASLYVYLANLGELHALVLDQALAAVRLPEARGLPWRDRLKAVLRGYRHVLDARQGLAQLALSTIATGPNSLRIWELLLGLLKEGGADNVKATWGVDLLTLYVTAVAAEQSNWRASGEGIGRVKNALLTVSAEEFPLVFASREAWLAGDADARFEWSIDVIVDGIVGGRLPAARATPARGNAGRKRRPGSAPPRA
jgi:AcrR family transcriptional regulator